MTKRTPTFIRMVGDIPEEHRELADQLWAFEATIVMSGAPPERMAQIYTCLAHDWYEIDVEEEGNRLLLKAEKIFPGYFKETVIKHALEDPDFDQLVRGITLELIALLVGNLNDRV